MDYMKYMVTMVLLLGVGFIYEKYKLSALGDEDTRNYELVKKYLVNDSSLAKSKLPILWIHLDYETNSRWWSSFNTRNSNDLNQPYLFLTIKSIIDKCGGDFNICVIDDDTYKNIVPGWNIDMARVADPIKSKLRKLAIARLLKHYGGLVVPPSFLCMKSLASMYYTETCGGKMFAGELLCDTSGADYTEVFISDRFMGAPKNCEIIDQYIQYLENLISQDYTDESNFIGSTNRWLNMMYGENKIGCVSGQLLGCQDSENKLVRIERIMGNTFIDFIPTVLGVLLPDKEILSRSKYQWFARLSSEQALECNNIAGKLLLTAR